MDFLTDEIIDGDDKAALLRATSKELETLSTSASTDPGAEDYREAERLAIAMMAAAERDYTRGLRCDTIDQVHAFALAMAKFMRQSDREEAELAAKEQAWGLPDGRRQPRG